MQTLTDGYGADKLTAWGIIFENKLLLTARRWKLYPITLGEPRRSNMTNIRAYSPTYTPGCNHGTTSLQEEIALQPTAPSAMLSSYPLWVFKVDAKVFFLLPSSMRISALTHFQLYDTESPQENTWHTWSDPPFGGMLFLAFKKMLVLVWILFTLILLCFLHHIYLYVWQYKERITNFIPDTP